MNQPARDQLQIAQAARTIAPLDERGRGAVLVGVARVDVALERLLQAVLLPTPGPCSATIRLAGAYVVDTGQLDHQWRVFGRVQC